MPEDQEGDPIWGPHAPRSKREVSPDGKTINFSVIPYELRPAEDIDPTKIPPRRWLYGRALIRSFVSVLVAPGGTGKSLWAMGVAVSLAIGRSLLGEHVYCRTNVWLINLDDPMDELNRRFAALRMHYGLPATEWLGRFFMNSGEDRPLAMAKMGADGFTITHPDEEAIEAGIRANSIGLLVVDPFAESHTLEENSNPQMVQATAAWRRVARRTGAGILLVHHVRKGSSGDIESARGAKALTDSARVGLLMSTMTAEEAEGLGIDEANRLSFVRMDDAKANMAPRAATAKWFELEHLELGNRTEEYPAGDQVAVLRSWTAPSPWESVDAIMLGRIFDAFRAGPEEGEFWSSTRQAKARWAGNVLMAETECSEKQAVSMIAVWKKNEVITDGVYASPKRKGKETGRLILNEAQAALMRHGNGGEVST